MELSTLLAQAQGQQGQAVPLVVHLVGALGLLGPADLVAAQLIRRAISHVVAGIGPRRIGHGT